MPHELQVLGSVDHNDGTIDLNNYWLVVDADVTMHEGTLNLNASVWEVAGNVLQRRGTIDIDGEIWPSDLSLYQDWTLQHDLIVNGTLTVVSGTFS